MANGMELTSTGSKLAAPFFTVLPIAGVAISVFDQRLRASVVHSSDTVSARLEEIQFDVGEGPSLDSFRTGLPVSVPDLGAADQWPAFSSYTDAIAAAALFLFPLTLGAACVGVVLCYSTTTGPLSPEAEHSGAALGRAIAGPAFRHAITLAAEETPDGAMPIELRREVHQATGIVLTQLGVSPTDAFARMRGYAFASGSSLRDVAHAVVTRQLDFSKIV